MKKMYVNIGTISLVFIAFTFSNGLKCNYGYDSGFSGGQALWNETECESDEQQRCLRAEGIIRNFGINFTFVGGSCVNISLCDLPCSTLANAIIASGTGVSSPSFSLNFSPCETVCCNIDNCNSNSIADIRDNRIVTPPSSPAPASSTNLTPTSSSSSSEETAGIKQRFHHSLFQNYQQYNEETDQTTFPALQPETELVENPIQCNQGFYIPSSERLEEHRSFRSISCPPNYNYRCLRQDLPLKGSSGKSVVIAACANQNYCEGACEEVAQTVINSFDATEGMDGASGQLDQVSSFALSCSRTCCEQNGCNDISDIPFPVSVISETTTKVAAVTTTSESDNGKESTTMGADRLVMDKILFAVLMLFAAIFV